MKKTFICLVLFSGAILAANRPNKASSAVNDYAKAKKTQSISMKEPVLDAVGNKIDSFFNQITPSGGSALDQRLKEQYQAAKGVQSIGFFEPTFILPSYFTFSPSPFYGDFPQHVPKGDKVNQEELMGQMSFLFPLWQDILGSHFTLNASYTQLMFWQVYSKSPFFRETNYEPRLFFSWPFHKGWLLNIGVVHQSNGRGGVYPDGMERSWNRVFADIAFSGQNWIVICEPWAPILTRWSSDLHNPDITDYLGYGRVIFAYKFHQQEVSIVLRHAFKGGFSRGAFQLGYEFPLFGKLNGYIQWFSGYGQSLIEYNHYTNALGFGVALSNWI